MTGIFRFFHGRTTFVMCTLLAVGCILAFLGKLTADFAAFGGMLHGFTVWHAHNENKVKNDAA